MPAWPVLPTRYTPRRYLLVAVFAAITAIPGVLLAQEAARPQLESAPAARPQDFGSLFDAVVEKIGKHFWDKDRLTAVGWDKRAAEARLSVVEAPTLDEAARRINILLGELQTSHTGLLTPDDVDYYVLMAVFGGAGMTKEEFDDRFWGAGVTYAGIGHFSMRIDGRHFVEAILEGSPTARAGLKIGDEIVEVDGAPYHPIRSFKGKIGQEAQVTIRRVQDAPTQTIPIKVMSITPLHAFREATQASARVIERDGGRIGYVHVWASVGDESANALSAALGKLHVTRPEVQSMFFRPKGSDSPPPERTRLDALIVDMRGKIGGTATTAGRYLDLLDPRGPRLGTPGKAGTSQTMADLRGRTAVLIDHHTRSTGELFVHSYKRERQGPLIGTRTAGAVSAASAYAMPGGNLLYVAVSGLEVDGEVLEGPGVAPDIEVARPVPYAQGADPVLERAVDVLVTKVKARNAPPAASSN